MRTLSASIPPVLNRESLLPAGSVAAEVRDSRKPEYWLPEMGMDGAGVKLSSLEHPKTKAGGFYGKVTSRACHKAFFF